MIKKMEHHVYTIDEKELNNGSTARLFEGLLLFKENKKTNRKK
jgi:hypothetical protein